jgi:nitrogen fixation NifU-like protein
MDQSLRELYQEVILDHSRHPRHFGRLEHPTHQAEGFNPLCGDKVDVTLVLDNDRRVTDIKFTGKGCAISQASASLMTEMLAGRTLDEAKALMGGFLHLVKGEEAHDLSPDDRDRLDVMSGISEFPMRVKCATLAWHTFKNAVEKGKNVAEEGAS